MTYCSMINEGYASLSSARVQVMLDPFRGDHRISICRQCSKAPCAEVCPQDAIIYDPATGALLIDYNLCDGCGLCAEACPFGALFWDSINERVIKCELCDGSPLCVEVCPTGALALQIAADSIDIEKETA